MKEVKYDVKKDCFAFKDGHCTALNDLYCAKENCSFYKSMQDVLNDRFVQKIKIKED